MHTKAIGILGGTFDPIHHGHLRMAIELQQALDLARVHIIPCFKPVHRIAPIASPQQRLAMVQCAIHGESTLLADDREIKRQGPSYTIDTLLELKQELPTSSLMLLIGIDSFLGFHSWHRWQDILAIAHLVVAHRPQYELPKRGNIAALAKERRVYDCKNLYQTTAGSILLQPITALEISATDIREQIAHYKNPRFLLPDAVYHYIQTKKLYHNEDPI